MADSGIGGPVPKRCKTENSENIVDVSGKKIVLPDFSHFTLKRVLNVDAHRKTIFLHGSLKDSEDQTIVILEKKAFDKENVKSLIGTDTPLSKLFCNDIYSNLECCTDVECNGIKVSVIHPATDKHLEKYEFQLKYMVEETPELYNSVTLPYIQEEQLKLQWVTNILEHKSEAERIVFEDPDPETGFVLLPDLKWDGQQLDSLYLLAIVRTGGLRSLRDLRGEHTPLLSNILEKGCEAVASRYGVPRSRLRLYLHYQPSFYHLHVHVTALQFEAPGTGVERAHLLPAVLSNLRLCPDYYRRATLCYAVGSGSGLLQRMRAADAL